MKQESKFFSGADVGPDLTAAKLERTSMAIAVLDRKSESNIALGEGLKNGGMLAGVASVVATLGAAIAWPAGLAVAPLAVVAAAPVVGALAFVGLAVGLIGWGMKKLGEHQHSQTVEQKTEFGQSFQQAKNEGAKIGPLASKVGMKMGL